MTQVTSDRHDTSLGSVPSDARIAVDRLVDNAAKALAGFESFTQEQVDHVVAKASVAAPDQHTALARLAVEETGRGVFEDKAAKNVFAREHVTHGMPANPRMPMLDDMEDSMRAAYDAGPRPLPLT